METIEIMVKQFCEEQGYDLNTTEYYHFLSVAYRAHTIGYKDAMENAWEMMNKSKLL